MKKIKIFIKIAIRNLLRNRGRSFITILMIAGGLAGIMFLRGFTDGAYKESMENFTAANAGHLQIYKQDFLQTLNPSLPIQRKDLGNITKIIDNTPQIESVTARILTQALASTATNAQGIFLLGISPSDELSVTRLDQFVTEGGFLREDEDDGILLGKELADTLKVKLGDKLVIFTQSYYGNMEAGAYRIKGFIESGGRDTDRFTGFITLKAAQKLMDYSDDEISCLTIKTQDIQAVSSVVGNLKNILEDVIQH